MKPPRGDGEKLSLPRKKTEGVAEGVKTQQEASSFVLALRGILSLYKLNINSTEKDIASLDQKIKRDLASTISDLIKERGINYTSPENREMVTKIKEMVGKSVGTLVEETAFGENIEGTTMEEEIEKTASILATDIDDTALSILKREENIDTKTRDIESLVQKKMESATKEDKWNPSNLKKLFNKILDLVKTAWNGLTMRKIIFKIGKDILEKREKDFMEHGI